MIILAIPQAHSIILYQFIERQIVCDV